MRNATWLSALALAAGMAGCASTTPPPELVAARQNFTQANQSAAAGLAPTAVYSARQALAAAEHAWAVEGDSRMTRDLAYIADRKAQLALSQGTTLEAQQQMAEAQKQGEALIAQGHRYTQQQLAASQQQLSAQRQQMAVQQEQLTQRQRELEAERAAREAAERRAQEAMEGLKNLGNVKQEARGVVLTLSGEVLFQFGKSDLKPIAQDRLSKVADVLKEQHQGQKIVIEGHTDSVGSDDMNQRLSEARARAVKDFLVSRGVSADMIEVAGRGEGSPIADNGTPEGRANNRRVEIILKPAAGGMQPGSSQQPQQGMPQQQPQQPKDENPYK